MAYIIIAIIVIVVVFVLSRSNKAPVIKPTTTTWKEDIRQVEYIPAPKPPFECDLSQYKSIQRTAICPSCLRILPKLPQRQQKCKLCGEQIIVASIPVTNEKVFLNYEEGMRLKKEIEIYWCKLSEKQEIAKRYYWWSEAEYYKNKRLFYDKFKSANENDFYFASAEQQIQLLLNKKDFFSAKMLSLDLKNKKLDDEEEVGYFYSDVADGEDAERVEKPSAAYPYACNVILFDLLENKKFGLGLDVVFMTDIDGCVKKHLNGTKMDIDELIRQKPMLIPCEICTANNMLYQCHINFKNK